jgi:hypothetical protein
MEERNLMFAPDLNPPTIASTIDAPAPVMASASAISGDIRAVQSWHQRELELATIREFSDNWDGRGSQAPRVVALDAAALFLEIWKKKYYGNPPARIALSPSGFLSVDWLDGEALMSAEIFDFDANEIEWMKAIPGQPTEFFTTALVDHLGHEGEQQVQTWEPAPDEPALAVAR